MTENPSLLELVYPNGTLLRIKNDLDLAHLRAQHLPALGRGPARRVRRSRACTRELPAHRRRETDLR